MENNKIIEVIETLCEKFGLAINWGAENLVPYVQDLVSRFVKYELWTSVFWLCFMPIVTLAVFFVTRVFHKKAAALEYAFDDDEAVTWVAIIGWILFGALTISTFVVIGVQVYDIIECYTLPEKLLLDYLTAKAA